MITNKGKDVIAKYMIGQAPAYASYLAIGCGATPVEYVADGVYGKTVIGDPDLSGMVTARLVVKSLTNSTANAVNNYQIGSKIIVRDVDDFFDGIYTISNIDINNDYVFYVRPAGTYSSIIDSGNTPIGTTAIALDIDNNILNKQNLDFEMIRVPIISRGYITDNNISQIVFTAELPTEERYEISEVGIYSAGSNPVASGNDSRTLFSFSQTETWKYHHNTIDTIPYIVAALDAGDNQANNIISISEIAFQANANNSALISQSRIGYKETTRFLNNSIMLRGDMCTLPTTGTGSNMIFNLSGNKALSEDHIHLTGANMNLNTNALTDEIRLAFSTVYKSPDQDAPQLVKIAVEFAHDETADSENARMEIFKLNNESSNRYSVVSKQLKDLKTTSNFLWSSVKVVKIFVAVVPATGTSYSPSDYYVALDAIRLENTTTTSPLYGMTGYSKIRNASGATIVKSPNTSNLVEFRFGMGVE